MCLGVVESFIDFRRCSTSVFKEGDVGLTWKG